MRAGASSCRKHKLRTWRVPIHIVVRVLEHVGHRAALLVQFPQVVSPPAVENIPIGSEPVRMSCIFTFIWSFDV